MDRETLKKMYTDMVRIRLCEESLIDPILNGEIKTPCHLYSGEEAIAVGICSALKFTDYIFSTHRCHGHYLAKGGDMKEMVAEIFGKETGCSHGRGGSMHLIARECGFLGSAPIVAGTISLALGAALAIKIRNENGVAVSFFGDGATGEGVLSESLNFASLKKLPIIFVCENNGYSTHLPLKEIRPEIPIYKLAESYGITSFQIDGNDAVKVGETAQKAVDMCRQGNGPVFIECMTYRFRGHVGPDDNVQGDHTDIRPKEELEEWKKKDPIPLFEKYLLENKIMEQMEIDKAKKDAEEEVKLAHNFARESAFPKIEEIGKYVFK